jgi:polysaccharide biosynthesis protein PslG
VTAFRVFSVFRGELAVWSFDFSIAHFSFSLCFSIPLRRLRLGCAESIGYPSTMKLFTGLLFCSVWLVISAGEIPPAVFPAGVGVNIHFVAGHQRDLDLIAAAGFKFVRMDFSWTGTESKKGEYRWSEYDELMADLTAHSLGAVFIFDYSNPLYESAVTSRNPITGDSHETTASPQHPESIAAYARWAAAAARHFHGRHIIWEIWNEPKISFWSPKPDAAQYTSLALAAAKAVRLAEPQATIVGPASSGFPWEFLETFLKSGILEYLDGVSVHPYREYRHGPETAAADFEKLRQLIDRFAPAARRGKIPILSGEWGYASHTRGVRLETQAAFAARQQLANLLNGVPLSIWYDWRNDGDDPNEREHNFGIVHVDLSPKPAYLALQTLTRQLSGFHVARRIALAHDQDYALICSNADGQQKLAVWTAGEPHETTVELPLKSIAAVKVAAWNGQTSNATVDSGQLKILLGPAPQYVTLER